MRDKSLNYEVLEQARGDALQMAAYLLPAIRGACKPGRFPAARFLDSPALTKESFEEQFQAEKTVCISRCDSLRTLYEQIGHIPQGTQVIGVEGLGVFSCGETPAAAQGLLDKASEPALKQPAGRMAGRVVIVTGGAQGLGRGIANILLAEGAHVVLADRNLALAQSEAERFCQIYGPDSAAALYADVTDDNSVARLCRDTVLRYGGIDVMFSNAGIVMSGDLEQMTSERMKMVADVNYIGYFRCAKYASRYMKIQSAFDLRFTADILNTSSVAGLIGYQKNFAYCGSKFGVLGLTECFAKELLPYGIKVNSVCPGNYYSGPLWNDPEKGLFVQYLKAGKIPNGRTVQDSIDYYMGREPFGRGCTPEDIGAGVLYCIEQQFETGIALPVTGGLAMGAV